MCCFFTTLVLFGPRLAIFIWWLIQPLRWTAAFGDSFIWPLLGFIFLPWTTLMFVLVAPLGNINGFDWAWLALALIADISSYAGGGWGNRGRIGYNNN